MKKHDYATEIEDICKQFDCRNYEEFKELVKASSEDEAYMLFLRGIRDEKTAKMNVTGDELDNVSSSIISVLQDANFRIYENAPVSLKKAIEKCNEAPICFLHLLCQMARPQKNQPCLRQKLKLANMKLLSQ